VLTHCFFKVLSAFSSHLLLSLPRIVFYSGFPTMILFPCLISHICVKLTAHLIRLDLFIPVVFGEEYKLVITFHYFILPTCCYFLLGPNVLVSYVLSNNFSMYSSLNTKYQISNPNKMSKVEVKAKMSP
jgi:hypothetical protein